MTIVFHKEEGIWDILLDSEISISIISWCKTKKGPITEISILSPENDFVLIELLDRTFRSDFSNPKDIKKTTETIRKICESILREIEKSSMTDRGALSMIARNLVMNCDLKGVHVYYGIGKHFGVIRSIFGTPKTVSSIPERAMEYPGTRLDADV